MKWNRLVDVQDLNWWLVLAGIGCDFALMAAVTTAVSLVLRSGGAMAGISQVTLMLGAFLSTFFTGFLAGWLAGGNGVTYGLVCCIGSLVVVIAAIPPGMFMLLVAIVAVAGGINGGLLSERRHKRTRG